MRLMCWMGLHDWVFYDDRHDGCVDTHARCCRPGCRRYFRWQFVNRDRVPTV